MRRYQSPVYYGPEAQLAGRLLLAVLTLLLGATEVAAAPAATAARAAVTRLRHDAPRLSVRWNLTKRRPTLLRGMVLALPGSTLLSRARSFLSRYPGLLVERVSDLEQLDVRRARGVTVLRFAQRYRGLPVDRAMVTMAFDGLGRLTAVHASTKTIDLATTEPKIDAPRAAQIAFAALRRGRKITAAQGALLTKASATLMVQALINHSRLVYRVTLPLGLDVAGRQHLVDALSGRYLGGRPGIRWHRHRRPGVRR